MTNKQINELKKSIFSDVSKYLQERLLSETESTSLNEGYWGTEPLANDYVLDIRDRLIQTNDDNFIKEIKRLSKGEPEDAWSAVGLCEFLIDMHIKLGIPYFLKHSDILELYEKAIDNSDDEEWFKGWKDPEEIKTSVENCRQNLKKYTKSLKNHKEF